MHLPLGSDNGCVTTSEFAMPVFVFGQSKLTKTAVTKCCRHTDTITPEGPRRMYYLVDGRGRQHLAASGRDTGQGTVTKLNRFRYAFKACDAFEESIPLHSTMRLAYLKKWLDACMAAGGEGGSGVGGAGADCGGAVLMSAQGLPYVQYVPAYRRIADSCSSQVGHNYWVLDVYLLGISTCLP